MKKLFRLSVMAALPMLMWACPKPNSVQQDAKFADDSRAATLIFSAEASNQEIVVKLAGEWKTTGTPTWVTVLPNKGNESKLTERSIKIGVEPNDGETSRTAQITFVAGTRKAVLTVTQNGAGMGEELYKEDCGPAVGSNTAANAHNGYIRGGTLDQSAVTYTSTQGTAIRNSMPATAAGFSGPALAYMGSGTTFTIQHINVTGSEQLIFKLGAGILEGVHNSETDPEHLVNPTASHLKIEVGYDGTAWATVPFTANQVNNDWAWVMAPFKVAAATTEIYVRISMLATAGGRVDDFSVMEGGNGTLINPEIVTPPSVLDPTALYGETLPTALPDGTTQVAIAGYVFDRKGTLNQAAVTYEATQSNPIRTTNPPSGTMFSGAPLFFINVNQSLTIGHINVTGNQALQLKFAAGFRAGSGASDPYIVPTASDLKLEVGYDGTTWAVVPFTGVQQGTSYAIMTAPFKVAAGTTAIYVKFSTLNAQGARYDDIQIIPGGNGDLIQPGGGGGTEPTTKKTIAQIRTEYAAATTAAPISIDDDYYIEGTVVSDNGATGGNLQTYQFVLQDNTAANSGIMINGASGVNFTALTPGTTVRVNLNNASMKPYYGLAQIVDVLAADVKPVSITAITTPQTITVANLKTGGYESMLIKIANVELVTKTEQAMNSGSAGNNGNIPVQVDASNQFVMRTASRAAFAAQPAPLGKGDLIGLGTTYQATTGGTIDYQVSPRTMADVAGMTAGAADFFTVTPNGAKAISAAAGTFDIAVSSNVTWTAVSSDPTNFTLSTGGATGSGTITVTYTANASTTQTRTATITVATTASVTPQSYAVNITQAAAAAGGTSVDWLAGWDMSSQSSWGTDGMAVSSNNSNSNVTIGGLTKTNFTGSGTAGASSWGGTGWDANSDPANPSRYATFTVTSAKTFTVASISLIRMRISATGAISTKIQYKVDSGSWTDFDNNVWTVTRPTSTSNFGPNAYTLPAALANLAGGTVVTFRIIPYSATAAGGSWYISNNGGLSGNAFTVSGSYIE